MRHFLEGRASVYALIAKDQLMSFQDLSCSACSARERAEVEASARSQREAAEARAGGGDAGGGAMQTAEKHRRPLGSSAPAGEDGASSAVAAALSLADAQMDEQWRAVSVLVWPRMLELVCTSGPLNRVLLVGAKAGFAVL